MHVRPMRIRGIGSKTWIRRIRRWERERREEGFRLRTTFRRDCQRTNEARRWYRDENERVRERTNEREETRHVRRTWISKRSYRGDNSPANAITIIAGELATKTRAATLPSVYQSEARERLASDRTCACGLSSQYFLSPSPPLSLSLAEYISRFHALEIT